MSQKRAVAALTAILSFVVFYWFATAGTFHQLNKPTNYYFYDWLAEGLMEGHAYIPLKPDPGLLALPDPYNPHLNEHFRYAEDTVHHNDYTIHDISLYNGRFYVYFGVAPAVLFYIPFKIIFGTFPSAELVTSLFCSLAVFFVLFALLEIERRSSKSVSLYLWAFICLSFVWGTGIPAFVNHSMAYEVPIAFGLFLTSLAIYVFFKWFMHRATYWSLAILSTCLGLLLLTRPTLFIVSFAYFWMLKTQILDSYKKRNLKFLFALFLPLIVCVVLTAAYNYSRFEDPLEFGLKYQLSGWPASQTLCLSQGFSSYIKCLALETKFYFLRPPRLQSQFPFVIFNEGGFLPLSGFYYHYETLIGVIFALPFTLLLLAATFMKRKNYFDDFVWNSLTLTLTLSIFSLLALALVVAAYQRYMLDFVHYIFIAGALVLLALWRRRPRITVFIAGLSLTWAIIMGFFTGIQADKNFLRNNPQLYWQITKLFSK